ncbi:hypothetical protein Dda_7427 [Drechslerella dactyloides]|uniref:Uncharacterized protein n=1 Tax=Drechslerella dactyloides TaxID=74499 RepID=A0AAD6IU04_DREDA|nr:hypothetical protein Dda_7427 [Drechslerella dactyloides]
MMYPEVPEEAIKGPPPPYSEPSFFVLCPSPSIRVTPPPPYPNSKPTASSSSFPPTMTFSLSCGLRTLRYWFTTIYFAIVIIFFYGTFISGNPFGNSTEGAQKLLVTAAVMLVIAITLAWRPLCMTNTKGKNLGKRERDQAKQDAAKKSDFEKRIAYINSTNERFEAIHERSKRQKEERDNYHAREKMRAEENRAFWADLRKKREEREAGEAKEAEGDSGSDYEDARSSFSNETQGPPRSPTTFPGQLPGQEDDDFVKKVVQLDATLERVIQGCTALRIAIRFGQASGDSSTEFAQYTDTGQPPITKAEEPVVLQGPPAIFQEPDHPNLLILDPDLAINASAVLADYDKYIETDKAKEFKETSKEWWDGFLTHASRAWIDTYREDIQEETILEEERQGRQDP